MPGAYGTENLVALLKLGFAAGNGLKVALADGKLDFSDLAQLGPVLPLLGPALDNIDQAPKEWADLDDAEAAELLAEGKALLAGVPETEAKVVLAKALKTGLVVGELVSALKLLYAPSETVQQPV